MSRAIVRRGGSTQPICPDRYLVRAHQPQRGVVLAGVRGRPGQDGQDADSGALIRQRGETLSALVVVYELDGQVYALDPHDDEHIDLLLGITLNAGMAGTEAEIRRLGIIDNNSWSWSPGRIWLGPSGTLTQTPPDGGFDALIGTAVSPTRVILNIQDSIELE